MLEVSWLLVGSNLVLLAIMFIMMRQTLNGVCPTKREVGLYTFLMLIFCLFSFWGGDWFHYQFKFHYFDIDRTHWEDIYIWIRSISPNYIVFRLIIWGIALFILLRSYKTYDVSYPLTLFIFGSLFLIYFSYGRVSLAFSILFLGYTLLSTAGPMQNTKKTIGIVLICLAVFFHKSALFGIATALFCYVYRRSGIKTFFPLLLMLPVLVIIAKVFLLGEMDSYSEEDTMIGEYAARGVDYMVRDEMEKGIAARLLKLLERIPFYGTAVLAYSLIQRNDVPANIKSASTFLFSLVLFSSIFAVDIGSNTSILYSRFLRFAIVPAPLVIAYCHENKIKPKLVSITFYLGLVGAMARVAYVMYCSFN